MLRERRAILSYDAPQRTARLQVRSGGGTSSDTDGTLLLDVKGRVVGVDVEPEAPSRVVVMAGQHEAVTETRPVRVTVTRDGGGDVCSVVVAGVTCPK